MTTISTVSYLDAAGGSVLINEQDVRRVGGRNWREIQSWINAGNEIAPFELHSVHWESDARTSVVINRGHPDEAIVEPSDARWAAEVQPWIDAGNTPDVIVLELTVELRQKCKDTLNGRAESLRSKFVTLGSGQAMTYLAKQQEAEKYLVAVAAGQTPSGEDFPLLSAELGLSGASLQEVASKIRSKADQWQGVSTLIEKRRHEKLAEIERATTLDEARLAANVDWSDIEALA